MISVGSFSPFFGGMEKKFMRWYFNTQWKEKKNNLFFIQIDYYKRFLIVEWTYKKNTTGSKGSSAEKSWQEDIK